jgi:hypothetical protein
LECIKLERIVKPKTNPLLTGTSLHKVTRKAVRQKCECNQIKSEKSNQTGLRRTGMMMRCVKIGEGRDDAEEKEKEETGTAEKAIPGQTRNCREMRRI